MSQSELRIEELASRAGVSIDTVRYYERQRLLPRAGGGFRLFKPEASSALCEPLLGGRGEAEGSLPASFEDG